MHLDTFLWYHFMQKLPLFVVNAVLDRPVLDQKCPFHVLHPHDMGLQKRLGLKQLVVKMVVLCFLLLLHPDHHHHHPTLSQ